MLSTEIHSEKDFDWSRDMTTAVGRQQWDPILNLPLLAPKDGGLNLYRLTMDCWPTTYYVDFTLITSNYTVPGTPYAPTMQVALCPN